MTVCEFDKKTILIVDDHALTRFGLKTVFLAQDFVSNIYEAGSFYEASSILFQHKPDIAIVDLGLPDVNGLELIKKIQEENLKTWESAKTYGMLKGEVSVIEKGEPLFIRLDMDEEVEYIRENMNK